MAGEERKERTDSHACLRQARNDTQHKNEMQFAGDGLCAVPFLMLTPLGSNFAPFDSAKERRSGGKGKPEDDSSYTMLLFSKWRFCVLLTTAENRGMIFP